MRIRFEDLVVRNMVKPGDLGHLIYLHGMEYVHGTQFETFVALGFHEFYANYDPDGDRVDLRTQHRMVGFLLLIHRENNSAQLRCFLIQPEFRGVGLGKHLMQQFMSFLAAHDCRSACLWTTHELVAAAITLEKIWIEKGKRNFCN
jgi:peptidyl-dipeptidase Dcp